MPPGHIHNPGERGMEEHRCGEFCPGQKGDAMILDMWRRARKDPHDWTQIVARGKPSINPGAKQRKGAKKVTMAGTARRASLSRTQPGALLADLHGPYGPPHSTADEEELGAVTDMPGVHSEETAETALHEGDGRAWVLHVATATATELAGFRPRTGE